jgi:cysteine desulfurase/selenocysteine lyase
MDRRIRSDFPVTRESTYLNSAFIGPSPEPVLRAGRNFLEQRGRGLAGGPDAWLVAADQARHAVAAFINAKANEIAFTTNTTEGTNLVATFLDLNPGDNIVWDDLDFPSNRLVWLHQVKTKGVENRVVKSKGGAVRLADFERLVDDRTRVISVSHVSHHNGFRHDVKALAHLAHSCGAYLHVDAIQAVGAVQVDVKDSDVDFVTCGTYKWLLGPVGLAFFYVRQELLPKFDPPFRGWMQVETWADDSASSTYELYPSARKFETATLHFQGIYEIIEALNTLNALGMDAIEERILQLASKLWNGLAGLNVEVLTPPETQSGIVTCSVKDGPRIATLLADNQIVVTVRGNHVRISPHFFNTEQEIDRLLDVMDSAC